MGTTGPVSVSMKEHARLIGSYAIFFKDKKKVPGKILAIEVGTPNKVVYEIMSGPEKGQVWKSKFEDDQVAFLYDEANLSLALLET
jgi:hypothetical protein